MTCPLVSETPSSTLMRLLALALLCCQCLACVHLKRDWLGVRDQSLRALNYQLIRCQKDNAIFAV